MTVLDPERPYTSYQRRQIISKLADRDNIDITAATTKFKAMELENPEGLKKLAEKFPDSPKDET